MMEIPISSSDLLDCYYEPSLLSSSSSKHDAYEVAIALNNAGVILIQNSYYLLAAESFRDALHVMKLATTASSTNSQDDVDIYEELSNKMTNISKRLLECHQNQHVLDTNRNHFISPHNSNLSILKYNGAASSISNAAIDTDIFEDNESKQMRDDNAAGTEQNYESSSDDSMKQYFVIQIIIDHHLQCPLYEIDTAIILYNYGIAYHYYSIHYQQSLSITLDDDQAMKDNVSNKSKQLFQLSYDLLQHISSINDDSNDNNDDDHLIILLLSCIVTMSLFHLAMDSNNNAQPDEAFHYYLLIRYMRNRYEIMNYKHGNVVDVYHLLEFDNEQHHAAAA